MTAIPSPAVVDDDKTVGVEILISRLLRIGVIASFVVIVGGIALMFVAHPGYLTSSDAFPDLVHPAEAPPFDPIKVVSGAINGNGESVITLGFLILTLTPVLRVAVSVMMFVYQKDRVFTVITLIVLGLLLSSIVLGKAGD